MAVDGDRSAWTELFGLAADRPEAASDEGRRGLFSRLRANLAKPRQAISPQLAGIFAPRLVTQDTWEELEEALIAADCGADVTTDLVEHLREEAGQGRITSGTSLASALWREVAREMGGDPPKIPLGAAPTVILIVGVNGSGKTTTIGKLAHRLATLDQRVVIGAADTFRAAAVDQLAVWAERSGAQLVRQAPGADPGAVAYDAVAAGRARGADVVLVDTAGRLQTQHNLMEELRKVAGVVGKVDPLAPHETLLVLDATTGQNGLSQAELFGQAVPLTGVVLTKLDGTARGGIALAIHRRLGLPVKLVGWARRSRISSPSTRPPSRVRSSPRRTMPEPVSTRPDPLTVRIPPVLLPADGRFGCGPSKVRPEAVPARAGAAPRYLGTSHRQAPVKILVGSIRAGLASCSPCPTARRSCSATAAPRCSGTSPRSGSSSGAASTSSSASSRRSSPRRPPPRRTSTSRGDHSPNGTIPSRSPQRGIDLYALTHNETSTGVAMPPPPDGADAARSSPSTPRRPRAGCAWTRPRSTSTTSRRRSASPATAGCGSRRARRPPWSASARSRRPRWIPASSTSAIALDNRG